MAQAEQRLLFITGLGHSLRGTLITTWPLSSRIASLGHALPHTPQSMQRIAFMVCRVFVSPEMAETGHILLHKVQPLQAWVIVCAKLLPSEDVCCMIYKNK